MTEALFPIHAESWAIVTLGEAVRLGGGNIQTGPFGSQLHASDYVEHGVPSVMPQNIGDNRIHEVGIARITESDAGRLSKYRLSDGDIVYSRRGDVERRSLVRPNNEGWLCGTGCLRVRFGTGYVVPAYAAYYLGHASVREWIVQHAVGATMPNLNTGILSSVPFNLPPLETQLEIASTLSNLDNKIELNRRMNETLEAMAQAIFRDWFVDFGPVRRKLAGETDPVTIMGGLTHDPARAAELASLFPAAFGEDGQPQGWELATLAELAAHCKGSINPLTHPGVEFEHYSLPAFDSGQEPAINRGADIKSSKTPVPEGAVLLSKLNPEIPRIWLPNPPSGRQQIASTEFLIFHPLPGVGRGLLYCLFRDPTVRQILAGMVTGTSKSHQRISPTALMKTPLLIGSGEVFGAFGEFAEPLLQRVLSLRAENRTLAETRDYLLPRLMSGQVRVNPSNTESAAA